MQVWNVRKKVQQRSQCFTGPTVFHENIGGPWGEKKDSEQKRIASVDPAVSDKSVGWKGRKKKEKDRQSLQFPRHEAGQQKHSGQINFYAGRFSRQPFDNLRVAHKGAHSDGGGQRER